MTVYKIFTEDEVTAFLSARRFEGSEADRRDGFVHLSTAEQVPGTAAKHFEGRGPLSLAALDEAVLGPELRWEPSRGGALFPHLYRAIEAGDVVWIAPYAPDEAGDWPMPGEGA